MLALVVQWVNRVRGHGNSTGAEHMSSALWLFASVGLGMAIGRSSTWYAGVAAGLLVYGVSIGLRGQVERLGLPQAPPSG